MPVSSAVKPKAVKEVLRKSEYEFVDHQFRCIIRIMRHRNLNESALPRCAFCSLGRKILPLEIQGHVDECNQGRDFDQRPDDSRERSAGIDPENGHGYRNRKLEIVARCGEGKRRRLGIVFTRPAAK
jgi:hypothetical protein